MDPRRGAQINRAVSLKRPIYTEVDIDEQGTPVKSYGHIGFREDWQFEDEKMVFDK